MAICEATTLIGAALSAGSMAVNSAAQSQTDEARSRVLQQNRARQAELQGQADALNQKSRQSYDGFDANQKAKAGDLASYFTDGAGPAAAQGAGQPTETAPGASSSIVQQEQAKQSGKAKTYTDQQGAALGDLRSFGDTLAGLDRSQARDAGAIGQIGNFMRGNSDVVPYELDAANHAGDGLRAVGDFARATGQLGITAGLLKNWAPTPASPSLPSFVAAQPQITSGIPQQAAPLAVGGAFSAIPRMFDPGMTQLPRVY